MYMMTKNTTLCIKGLWKPIVPNNSGYSMYPGICVLYFIPHRSIAQKLGF